jgi:segregation and condensation protein A
VNLAPANDPLRVTLPVFEGPLDLLLYLIRKEEVDIYQVELGRITDQYLSCLEKMQIMDLEVAGEFLVVAATLVYIKSRTLLPVDQQAPEEEMEEGDDPRWELIRQLVEYKKFKEAAEVLGNRAALQEMLFTRPAPPAERKRRAASGIGGIEMIDLVRAFQQVLQAARERSGFREIHEDRYTVSEKIDYLLDRIRTEDGFLFHELFGEMAHRAEIVVTFLAVLELIRLRKLRAVQGEVFGEIRLERVEPVMAS